MAALQDRQMERLSNLLAAGKLGNAQEIASLLEVELSQRADLIPENERRAVLFRAAQSDH